MAKHPKTHINQINEDQTQRTSIKGEINNNTVIVGDFNTPLMPMDRSTKQKISKETQTLNDAME